ncbi:MAG: S-methyl-5'-thioinosine phosphorylase [Gammaproteobacteria bacterium]|nr:MAG: S-methyl-5'-thioinosine phosphorylase [Gammaproteobacteria bacterium]
MVDLAIIGGTGLTSLYNLKIIRREVVHTPYGEPSGALTIGELCGNEVVFLARHGYGHTIPPHMVNYRANLWALKHAGIKRIISICAVGGIRGDIDPGSLVIPDQIIDYTWSRHHTFFEKDLTHVTHIDFTHPYCEEMRSAIAEGAASAGIDIIQGGTYGATQGPRLESAAEINRMARDGCDMVGMTGMPEVALAKEIDLCYAACAVCANKAAGRSEGIIEISKIETTLKESMVRVRQLLEHTINSTSC